MKRILKIINDYFLLRKTTIVLFLLLLTSFLSKENEDYIFPEIKHFPKQINKIKITLKEVELGKFLFYDPILSIDSSISCASCHRQELSFSYFTRYKTDNESVSLGGKRDIMPLFNLAWSPRFFWDGRAKTIEEQVYFPVRDKNEMRSDWVVVEKKLNSSSFYKKKFKDTYKIESIDSIHITKSIAAFLRTLLSYNSKFDKVKRNEAQFTKDELEGFNIMQDKNKGNCFGCHSTEVSSSNISEAFSNNGLLDSLPKKDSDLGYGLVTKKNRDFGKFKIPSLRNLGYTAPYMHDGRFRYLDFVLNFYSEGVKNSKTIDKRMLSVHNGGARLTRDEKLKILAFLSTLNDSTFVNNKAFSNPFITKK